MLSGRPYYETDCSIGDEMNPSMQFSSLFAITSKMVSAHYGNSAFCPFVDDHMGAATSFEAMFDFLHNEYFPRVAFGPLYLSGKKTHMFTDSLEMVGFTGS